MHTIEKETIPKGTQKLAVPRRICNLAVMQQDPALLGVASRHIEASLRVFIEHGITRYQRHAERLLGIVDGCNREALSACSCD